jgi:hypothetical protein
LAAGVICGYALMALQSGVYVWEMPAHLNFVRICASEVGDIREARSAWREQ